MSLLRQRSVRNILIFVFTNNNCIHEEIVKQVHLSPSTVSWHLKKLEDKGIVGFLKKGRKTHYNILIDKNEIMNLLIVYQESFFDNIVDNIVEMWDTG